MCFPFTCERGETNGPEKGEQRPPPVVDGQDRQQAWDVTDAKGKGLALLWRDPCAGPNRTRGRQADQWQTARLEGRHETQRIKRRPVQPRHGLETR